MVVAMTQYQKEERYAVQVSLLSKFIIIDWGKEETNK